MEPKLNELLHWAVENTSNSEALNQTQSTTALAPLPTSSHPTPLSITYHPQQSNHQSSSEPKQTKKLDTGVLDAILGRTDAVRMREAMSIFEDPNRSIQERSIAGEELEELIQDLDNANDMEVLGLWPKLIHLLETSNKEEEELVKFHACWICGTAVQNNPKSQIAFLKKDPLPVILEILCHGTEPTQAKAMYCLSSTLKHAPESTNVMTTFRDSHGWEALHDCLRGPSMNLRRKTVFLINTLLLEDSLDLNELRSTGILSTLITSLSPSRGIPTGQNGDLSAQDEDYSEKALRTIVTILINSSGTRPTQKLQEDEKKLIQEILLELKGDGSFNDLKPLVESASISESEWTQTLEILGLTIS